MNKQNITSFFLKLGFQITPDAFEFLSNVDDLEELIKKIRGLSHDKYIISKDLLLSLLEKETAPSSCSYSSSTSQSEEVNKRVKIDRDDYAEEKNRKKRLNRARASESGVGGDMVKAVDVKKKKSEKRRLNELDGKTWTRYSISVWNITKTPEEVKLKHPAMFPQEMVKRLIEIYTKEEETVLDPFLGSGSTVLAARELGRKGIGFEISEEYVNLVNKRLEAPVPTKFFSQEAEQKKKVEYIKPEIYLEDAKNLPQFLSPESVDLVVTSPPYWDIHRQKRTSDYKEIRPYTDLEIDLGNISDYSMFISALKQIFQKVRIVLKTGKWCVIIVMDLRKKDKFYPFHSDIADMMTKIGFKFEDIIIWDRRQEYNLLRPLGYPYVFRVNKIHEYIMIFSKEPQP